MFSAIYLDRFACERKLQLCSSATQIRETPHVIASFLQPSTLETDTGRKNGFEDKVRRNNDCEYFHQTEMIAEGQWDGLSGKVPVGNPNDLNLIPGSHMVEGKSSPLPRCPLTSVFMP